MPESNVAQLATQVVWAGFAVSFVLGIILHRTHFCPMGAVADIVTMGDWQRMRMWVLAIGVAILGTGLLAASGQIDTSKTIYTAARLNWLSHLVGGLLFGFGMVLASGCGSKNLVRLGGGNLKSLVVFLALGVAALATLRGLSAVLRVATVDQVSLRLPGGQDLPALLAGSAGLSRAAWHALLAVVFGLACIGWAAAAREFRGRAAHWLGGVGAGVAIVAVWWISGHLGYLAEHPDTLQEAFVGTQSGRMESLSFVAPYGYALDLLTMWSDASKTVTLGIASVGGVVLGACAHALATRSFRWEGFSGAEDTANHLVGGALMGVGGVTALGCTIGQGLSGISTLAIGSAIALVAIVAGAIAALRYQAWRLG